MSWCDFENELLREFKSILNLYDNIKDEINEDTRKDFLGLLQYTIKSRKSFRPIASEYGITHTEPKTILNNYFDMTVLVKELLEKDLDSFASEYSNFPLILNNHFSVSNDILTKLCFKYWKHRYPSVKTSFIIPLCSKISLESSEDLKSLLLRRLLKGKLDPFDESIQLCKSLQISPDSTDFYDHQLAALKDLLQNHRKLQLEQSCALEQSGCHCD